MSRVLWPLFLKFTLKRSLGVSLKPTLKLALALVLATGLASGALAQTAGPTAAGTAVANPYSATVPVAGTSDAQRNTAMTAALVEVLQQVSPGFSAPADVLARASGYVRQYQYRRAASGGLELQVVFDSGAVGRMVAQARDAAGGAVAGQPGTATSTGAIAMAQGSGGTLWVDGIDNSHAFASMLSALRADPAMRDVVPVAAEDDGVMLRVTTDQSLATALAVLAGPVGHLAPAAEPHPGADVTLRWVP